MPRVIITGSDGSLGRVLVERAYKLGWNVVTLPKRVMFDKAAIEDMIDEQLGGPIDYIINNHGINHLSWIGETPENDEQIYQANVMGPYWVVNHVAKSHLNTPVRVLNILSQTYRVAQRTTALYCASKAAIAQMTKVMAREMAQSGWIVNGLAPGKIEDTEMSEKTDTQVAMLRGGSRQQWDKYARDLIPMGRYTNCAEVADAVFKILELPAYINGSIIDMTGGV